MLQFLKQLIKPKLTSLNRAEIFSDRLLTNVHYLQSLHPDDGIFPVLKSNAYGHGLREISKLLRNSTLPFICVDSYPEYQFVKKFAKKKVLILGETAPQNYRYYHPQYASITVYSIPTLKYLSRKRKKHTIHLFLNTGMQREGIQIHDLGQAIDFLKEAPHLELEGVMSHFANADMVHASFNEKQIEQFKHMYSLIKQAGFSPRWKHIGNSAGLAKVDDNFFNAWRPGLALYGYNHLSKDDPYYSILEPLQPALRILSKVVSIQYLQPGDRVSYGGVFQAAQAMMTATIPFGYHEGLTRSLSGQWLVKWDEEYLPLIGNICMNLSCLDTKGKDVAIGDDIEVISPEKDAENTIQAFAKKSGMIPYEVLVNLDEKIKRVIV